MLGSPNVFLVIGTRSVKAGPVRKVIVSVREHVIVLGCVRQTFGVDGVHIHRRCREDQLDVCVLADVLIVVINQSLTRFEILSGILEAEVVTHRDNDVVARVVLTLLKNPLVELCGFFGCVERGQSLVSNERVVRAKRVKIKARRCAVVVIESVPKDLGAFAKRVEHGPPDKFHRLILKTFLLVLEVEASEEKGVETHLSKEPLVGV